MILGADEKIRELPEGASYSFVKGERGWDELFVTLPEGSVIPVFTGEASGPCLISDSEGTPLKVIEPSILG